MKIHQLLSTPDKWTQRAFAKTETGEITGSLAPEAKCWCLVGAIAKCYDDQSSNGFEMRTAVTRSLMMAAGNPENIVKWNDDPSRTHAEVLELVKRLDV